MIPSSRAQYVLAGLVPLSLAVAGCAMGAGHGLLPGMLRILQSPSILLHDYILTGDALNPNALRLVSMMCDSVSLEYRDGVLAITLVRLSGDEPSVPAGGDCP